MTPAEAQREAERALRAGDLVLAAELMAAAGEVQPDALRRMSRAELEALEPELLAGCGCSEVVRSLGGMGG